MVKFTFPTQETNPLVEDGSIGQKMETMLGKLQPEAAYFGPIDGKRGGFIVINMEEESEVVIPFRFIGGIMRACQRSTIHR